MKADPPKGRCGYFFPYLRAYPGGKTRHLLPVEWLLLEPKITKEGALGAMCISADENRPHSYLKGLNSIPGECSNRAKDLGGSSVESLGAVCSLRSKVKRGEVEDKNPLVPESLKEKTELKKGMENPVKGMYNKGYTHDHFLNKRICGHSFCNFSV